jgi:DNA-directed RNA polymerase specialized sigma24 family protein
VTIRIGGAPEKVGTASAPPFVAVEWYGRFMAGNALAELSKDEFEALYKRVLAYAFARCGSKDAAVELAQDAFARAFGSKALEDADPGRLLAHLQGAVNGTLSNQRTERRARYEREAGVAISTLNGGATPSAEALAIDHGLRAERREQSAQFAASLRAALSAHPLELALLDHMANDISSPAHLAEQVERPVAEVYRALARIRRYALRIAGGAPPAEEGH